MELTIFCIFSLFLLLILLIILSIIYQQSTLNIHDETVHESSGVGSAPMRSDFQANPTENSFVDNFRFTKAEDILFAKTTVNTSII